MDRARVRDEVSPGEIYEHPPRGGGRGRKLRISCVFWRSAAASFPSRKGSVMIGKGGSRGGSRSGTRSR